ncbi:bifunctional tRNA (5-methylaminomethyl-2-thiouridine)(34)-methyltransferase MnmD/FAD-dependent 5-carboxymethylaminomethyl-2-thiouridine(34) oxidoreductase MnmC [Methylophilus aquaticus]|uniref:tRNA 5-methylaminomethyl-2-thiouridine biosynthesis bifunctional protein MnmC n=1 Tax=Methylophilus aquaticus TaxID=1971610 RepID=A0ABT9JTF8_9PROT|nr:bifunctional tRNA (5-methylaminomethyl-2-thiouridine)(34)-methyltransferase MnmD/FAD-dependent 5-carboxymethylaminomethyl-2-thiouridine(34) oxidoreductase MnmC [Methylophilus aquaticus]MDP8567799.1 bifunctional tRNA (5-methylaminomethyl-2-thiouridine)(34)-methyltransferase MnmD/FAD-dependent 5-carboxymethylaminomethyl-2-thiouridine(34) oxidoreductase MnmC [Methylophilus aquaticus]
MNMHADLEWHDGLPYSTRFQDIYFSASAEDAQHGLAETRHVFLQHNQLAQRWTSLPPASHFTIIETGFGSGLNFLAAVELWLQTAPPDAHLHVVSIEIAPFTREDLQRAHAHFPQLRALSAQLCAQYSLLHQGFNQIELPEYRTSLTLMIGDVATCLPALTATADAWFLDGFAPSKNPEMWHQALFSAMGARAHAGTTFATFTSAGLVRRGLQAAGFTVEKTAGYGQKREMLKGQWSGKSSVLAPSPRAHAPNVAVIGAGIAGCSTAWHLAQMGCKVTLFERESAPASGASGNPKGMLYPRLNTEKPLNDGLALRSYSYALKHYTSLQMASDAFQMCGLLQLGGSAREQKRVRKVAKRYSHSKLLKALTAAEASVVAGVEIASEALFFPEGAWVNPVAACHAYLRHPLITTRFNHSIGSVVQINEAWQLSMAEKPMQPLFDAVVVTNASEASTLLPDSGLLLSPLRGQMGVIHTQAALQSLKTILCGDGYVTPMVEGQHALGATFSPGDTSVAVREADNQANLDMLASLSPQFSDALKAHFTAARAAIRCGTSDYLPDVGPVWPTALLQQLATISTAPLALPAANGLYVHVGHGSKGLMTAPYCAALLARTICRTTGMNVPLLSEQAFWLGLTPQRQVLKALGMRWSGIGSLIPEVTPV